MAVVQYSGNANGNAIGLIACSRHQASGLLGHLPNAEHRPKMDFVNPVNGGPAVDYLRRELGYESTRSSRKYFKFWDSEQWTGHTALFVRLRGQAAWARGWVPQPTLMNYARALVLGGETPGEWQDDLPMIDDPTAISLEYDVNALDPRRFLEYWEEVRGHFTTYCFTVQGAGRCNCVWAATTVLREFAAQHGFPQIAAGLAKVRDCAQGKLMGQIAGGELLTS